MEIIYPITDLYINNLFIGINDSSMKPTIKINFDNKNFYTLLMFDPEAIKKNKIQNKIHWLIVNITNNDITTGNILFDYKGPCPPKNSGFHHYVFVLSQQNYFIRTNNIKFNSRFVELDKLFKIIGANQYNFIPKIIKYFKSSCYDK
jgi:phosphatidylethanolamine-binding protein (PEBP) family uncharacterized protein